MLVLGRKKNEGLLIGDTLVVVVRDAGGGVRLGIDAPRETNIARVELLPQDEQRELLNRYDRLEVDLQAMPAAELEKLTA